MKIGRKENKTEKIAKLRGAMREIYEAWGGSEFFSPSTATELYYYDLVEEMRDIAAEHLQPKDEGK